MHAPCPASAPRARYRHRTYPLAVLAPLLVLAAADLREAEAQQPQYIPSVGGEWSPLYDWSPQLNCAGTCTEKSDISAAAVLPLGLHRGRILFWRESCANCATVNRTTETFLFDPDDPDDLIKIAHPLLDTDLFCAGFSWERDGSLLVTGGNPTTTTGQARWTYYFYPALLEEIKIDEGSGLRSVSGDAAWERIGDANDSRYYPSVVPLNRRAFGSPAFAGSGHLVLGGVPAPRAPAACGTIEDHGNIGVPRWQHIGPQATAWDGRVMYPAGGTPPLPPFDVAYDRTDINGQPAPANLDANPVPRLETYPRAFQLGDLGQNTQGQVFVANDMPAFSNALIGSSPITPYGAAWVVKPTYSGQAQWELQEARTGHERFYGTAGLWHMTSQNFLNRIVVFGGAENVPPGTPANPNWTVVPSVEEFVFSGSSVAPGNWTAKTNGLQASRIMANLVILPTGQALILGGGSSASPCEAGPGDPVYSPEIYDIGNPSGTGAFTTQMNSPTGVLVPRLYHSMAALLQDGRVLVAGGEYDPGISPNPPPYPHSEKNGQVFSPPYLFQGSRPTIVTALSDANFSTSTTPQTMSVTVNHTQPIDRIVLLRPGTITHAFDIDQRYIELTFTPPPASGRHSVSVTLPTEDLGPPGWYMMFAVQNDGQGHRVPSIAWWIHIT